MSTQEFYNRHKNNGGDLAKWDGSLQEQPQPKRQPNPKLKRHNYKFINQIEVVEPEFVKFAE
jgi:hypothetical protein